jgi:hypothetical protein
MVVFWLQTSWEYLKSEGGCVGNTHEICYGKILICAACMISPQIALHSSYHNLLCSLSTLLVSCSSPLLAYSCPPSSCFRYFCLLCSSLSILPTLLLHSRQAPALHSTLTGVSSLQSVHHVPSMNLPTIRTSPSPYNTSSVRVEMGVSKTRGANKKLGQIG